MTATTRPPKRTDPPRPKQPRQYVDAEPVREHLHYLSRNGIGMRATAHITGASESTIESILFARGNRPANKTVAAHIATAILAIRPTLDTIADGAYIDATGSYRRLQALVALGFPARFLANRLGHQNAATNTYDPPPVIRAEDARAIRGLYDELSMLSPRHFPEIGIRGVTAARNRAKALGWPLPLEWDDDEIDNPNAQPRSSRRPDAKATKGCAVTDDELEDLDWILRTEEHDTGTRDGRARIGARLGVTEHRVEYMLGILKRQRMGVAA